MKINKTLQKKFSEKKISAIQAQRMANEISFAPIVFQVSRLMKKFNILKMLIDSKTGLTFDEIVERTGLSKYACLCLLESSLTIGIILYVDNRFMCSKAGWFLVNDQIIDINMDFNHHVNYLGLFHLEEALLTGNPKGLESFGNFETIHEAFCQLPENVQDNWIKFNHFYSDHALEQALKIVFVSNPRNLLDIGGNIGNWALSCVNYDQNVSVTVIDLPHQIDMMTQNITGKNGANRIFGQPFDLLDTKMTLPTGFEVIWMSQLLDNFSSKEIVSILKRVAKSMSANSKLYIMDMFWDRQNFETGAFVLTQMSPYFTALVNGKSKIYSSDEMIQFIEKSKLSVVEIFDGIGKGHTIIQCQKK